MKRNSATKLIIAILILSMAFSFISCGKKSVVKIAEMPLEELEKCISLSQYKDLTVTLGSKTKGEAIVDYICKNSIVKKYPNGTVDYYFEQLKEQYHYYADEMDIPYEVMLDELGEDNVTMKAASRELVKKDMVLELIRKKEGISLTEEEKASFFDKYVKKFAESYKFSEEYVRENLPNLVYQSMLHDKTVEFLIVHNNFA